MLPRLLRGQCTLKRWYSSVVGGAVKATNTAAVAVGGSCNVEWNYSAVFRRCGANQANVLVRFYWRQQNVAVVRSLRWSAVNEAGLFLSRLPLAASTRASGAPLYFSAAQTIRQALKRLRRGIFSVPWSVPQWSAACVRDNNSKRLLSAGPIAGVTAVSAAQIMGPTIPPRLLLVVSTTLLVGYCSSVMGGLRKKPQCAQLLLAGSSTPRWQLLCFGGPQQR
jgi:hypothetical protein